MRRKFFSLELRRRQLGLTQGEFGNKVGLSQNDISELERGLQPSGRQLKALGEFFGLVDPSQLFREAGSRIDLEAEFANKPGLTDSIVIRQAKAAPDHGVPPPPNMAERIKQSRGE